MNIEKINGGYQIAEVVNGYRLCQVYFGYTKRESVAKFKKFIGK